MTEQIQLGAFIRERRLALEMTQKQLADRIGVTDKAVSKWERDAGCPDISLLRPLAEALEVSAAELLAGQLDPPEEAAASREAADTALQYAQQVRGRHLRGRRLAFVSLTLCCLTAAGVCLICDSAISGRYTWSLIVLLSVTFGWMVCVLPLLSARPFLWALGALTAGSLPYLAALGWLLKGPLVFRLSLGVVPLAAAWLWAAYLLCRRLDRRKWLAAGLALLLLAPACLGVNAVLDRFLGPGGSVHGLLPLLLAGLACCVVDLALHGRK